MWQHIKVFEQIQQHVAGTLSNQQPTTHTAVNLSATHVITMKRVWVQAEARFVVVVVVVVVVVLFLGFFLRGGGRSLWLGEAGSAGKDARPSCRCAHVTTLGSHVRMSRCGVEVWLAIDVTVWSGGVACH